MLGRISGKLKIRKIPGVRFDEGERETQLKIGRNSNHDIMSDLTAVEIGCLEQFDGKARNKVELDRDSNELMTD